MKPKTPGRIVLSVILAGLVLPPLILYSGKTLTLDAGAAAPITLSLFEQMVIIVTAFVMKPVYQVISLITFIMLWKRTDSDLASLKWGIIAFFIGENACALNYLAFHEGSLFMEYVHAYGMLVFVGFVAYAMMEAFDNRVFHFSEKDRTCALLAQCGRCYKYGDSRCNMWYVSLFVVPAAAVIVGIPLSASLGSRFYAGDVFGSTVLFGHPVEYQFLETRIYPAIALVFFLCSFAALLLGKEKRFDVAKILFAMGLGPLGFSLLRFLFYWGYQATPLWADAWEEITEFLFILFIFWIVLRVRAVSRQPEMTHS